MLEESRSADVPGPVSGRLVPDRFGSRVRCGAGRGRACGECAFCGQFLLEPGNPRRNSHAQHVADGAGIAGGNSAGEFGQFRSEDLDGRNHLVERHENVPGVGFSYPVQDVAAEFLSVELDLDAHTRLRGVVERRGHAVVKGPVQVRQRGLDEHPGNRQPGCEGGSAGRLRTARREPLEQ